MGHLIYPGIMAQQNSIATYKTGFVTPWILSSNLKIQVVHLSAGFGLENLCFPGKGTRHVLKSLVATLKSGLEFSNGAGGARGKWEAVEVRR